jgi:hypothetical protein
VFETKSPQEVLPLLFDISEAEGLIERAEGMLPYSSFISTFG